MQASRSNPFSDSVQGLALNPPVRSVKSVFPLTEVAVLGLIMLTLHFVTRFNYLLFHSAVELFSVVVAATIFFITILARRRITNHYFLVLGTVYGFVAILDTLHTLSFRGMGLFADYDYYAPQFWIAARALEAAGGLAGLAALHFWSRHAFRLTLLLGGAWATLCTLAILVYKVFPVCFVPGIGLTAFKLYAEYGIIATYLTSIYLMRINRSEFSPSVYALNLISLALMVCMEFCFTLYSSNAMSDTANELGHILKFMAFYTLFKALAATAIQEPLDLLVLDLARKERNLEQQNHALEQTIDQLEHARDELAETDNKLNSVLTATGEGTWDWDISTGAFHSNQRWHDILQLNPQPLDIGEFAELLLPEDRAEVFRILGQCLNSGEIFSLEHRMRRADGSIIWVLDRGVIYKRDHKGHPLQMVGSITDITSRKLAELALADEKTRAESASQNLAQTIEDLRQSQQQLIQSEKLNALGRLVAGVAHELNTPLGNSVMASSTLLEQVNAVLRDQRAGVLKRSRFDTFLDETRLASELIQRNAMRAAKLVSSFKEVAVNQTSMIRRPFSLKRVVSDAAASIMPLYSRLEISLDTDIPDDITLLSYPGAVDQILFNLIQNCVIHATRDGAPLHIRINARSDADHVVITVSDDGTGMPEEVRKRVFDPFFTTRFGQGGSGMGLYLVYSIATSILQGEVSIESSPGGGTRIELRVPRETREILSPATATQGP